MAIAIDTMVFKWLFLGHLKSQAYSQLGKMPAILGNYPAPHHFQPIYNYINTNKQCLTDSARDRKGKDSTQM